jgi:hypothetical protein
MILTPIPVGLILCDFVLVEQGTKKVSLIGSFREVFRGAVPRNPSAVLRLRCAHRWYGIWYIGAGAVKVGNGRGGVLASQPDYPPRSVNRVACALASK